MTDQDEILTTVGPASVLHRLALGVVVLDGLTSLTASGSTRVGRQVHRRLLGRGYRPSWPCLDLDRVGPGRFRIRHATALPHDVVLRFDDPTRRYVPRRVSIPLWPLTDVSDDSPGNYVPVGSRTLRLWLHPGAAYPLPRSSTVVRGRVTRDGLPVRWARVDATDGAGNVHLGRTHGNDRGEFLLVLGDVNQNPLESTVGIALTVSGPPVATPPDEVAEDPLADLPVEPVARPGVPPLPADLDNPVLRGVTDPPGYVANTAPSTHLTVPVGAELVLTQDVDFTPQP